MVRDVVGHEGRDEVVAVVVTLVLAQRQLLARFEAGGLEQIGVQLLGEKLVGQALVDQQRRQARARLDQLGGVMSSPGVFLSSPR